MAISSGRAAKEQLRLMSEALNMSLTNSTGLQGGLRQQTVDDHRPDAPSVSHHNGPQGSNSSDIKPLLPWDIAYAHQLLVAQSCPLVVLNQIPGLTLVRALKVITLIKILSP
jgi:hypothetical protein